VAAVFQKFPQFLVVGSVFPRGNKRTTKSRKTARND
jgi:hypothetical protein